ncbi:hypothetical protein OGATHE_002886 [Ogataea polymorpha]|uniref:Uncharacterized protein n=1 Tax=Ogataea polymorpha TaxID=460523 RepID=A0A9P8PD51_9ASCO|nr:hypothetical protein OGATHE_002886 [Ogataea polymorpha]
MQYVANEYTAEFMPPAGAPTLMIAIFLRCSTGSDGSRKSAVFIAMKLFRCSTNSESRNEIALAKSFALIASATDLVSLTASTSGFRTILFSTTAIIGDGVSGVPSRTASTAATPCIVANSRSFFVPRVIAGSDGVAYISDAHHRAQRVHHRPNSVRGEANTALKRSPVDFLFMGQQVADIRRNGLLVHGLCRIESQLNGALVLGIGRRVQDAAGASLVRDFEP